MKKRYIWILAVLALPCSFAGNAQQIYPSRPVRLIITVPPGGAADLIARIMAQKLGDAFGQTFVADNRAGGGGQIAADIVAELFKTVTGIPSQHVPYKGSGPAAADIAGGHVQFMFDAIAPQQPHIKSGRTKALAVVSPARVSVFPDTPTMAELGYPRVAGSVWYGLMAPAGTPKKIIAMLNAESNRILATQEVKDRMAGAGIDAAGGTPEEFGNFIRAELAKWGPVVKAAGAKLD
jgi:tripartite-type tricarboxylate transporter receptor subunit TctC